MHLNDEQFEDALLGSQEQAGHLAACARCRSRLESHKAMQARTREALGQVRAGEELVSRIRGALGAKQAEKPKRRALYVRLMPALAAAAAALVILVPLIAYFASTQPAQAAAAELAQIHQNNLGHHELVIQDDPAKLAGYFKTQLGFTPAMPRMGQGMAMRGCCVAHFRGGVAGSYVVDTPSGPVSIIVVRDRPGELGLKDVSLRNSQSYYQGAFAHCNLVAVRLGDYTYCAVGTSSVPHEKLTELLGLLVK